MQKEERELERLREQERIRAGKELLAAKKLEDDLRLKRNLEERRREKEEEARAKERIRLKLGRVASDRHQSHQGIFLMYWVVNGNLQLDAFNHASRPCLPEDEATRTLPNDLKKGI